MSPSSLAFRGTTEALLRGHGCINTVLCISNAVQYCVRAVTGRTKEARIVEGELWDQRGAHNVLFPPVLFHGTRRQMHMPAGKGEVREDWGVSTWRRK